MTSRGWIFACSLVVLSFPFFINGDCCFNELGTDGCYRCRCKDGVACDPDTGACPGECQEVLGDLGDYPEYAWHGANCQRGNLGRYVADREVNQTVPRANWPASNAVDGVLGKEKDNTFCSKPYNKSYGTTQATWFLNLQRDYIIESVYIHNADKGSSEMRDFEVTVISNDGTETCDKRFGPQSIGSLERATVTCPTGTRGQYVRFRKISDIVSERNKVDICEVVVMGYDPTADSCFPTTTGASTTAAPSTPSLPPAPDTTTAKDRCCFNELGTDGCYRCRCKDDTPCDPLTGTCPGNQCADVFGDLANYPHYNWRGINCQRGNLGRSIPARVVNQTVSRPNWPATNALDGVLGKVSDNTYCSKPYNATDNLITQAWWELNLQEDYVIESVHVHNADNGYKNMKNFEITVISSDGTETCEARFGPEPIGRLGVVNVTCPDGTMGQYVRFRKVDDAASDRETVDICEVVVIGYDPKAESCIPVPDVTSPPTLSDTTTTTGDTTTTSGRCCFSNVAHDGCHPCRCKDGAACDPNTGACPGGECADAPGDLAGYLDYIWHGPNCQRGNLLSALSAGDVEVNQTVQRGAYPALNAIDGRLARVSDNSACSKPYDLDDGKLTQATWNLNLDRDYVIESVHVHNGYSGYKELRDFELEVLTSNGTESCGERFGPEPVDRLGVANMTCPDDTLGQYVRFRKVSELLAEREKVDICEVVVIGYDPALEECLEYP